MFTDQPGRQLYEAALRELARGNLPVARGLMSRAAKLNHLSAMSAYATMLEHGIGGKSSMSKAIRWLKITAERGDSASAERLAVWFREAGKPAEAKHWLQVGFPNWRNELLLAKLFAESRSCRATRTAKRLVDRTLNGTRQFSKAELVERGNLSAEFRKRNPNYDPTKRARPYRR